MRVLLLLGAVALILATLGIVSLTHSGDKVTLEFDKVKAREATEDVLDAGKRVGESIADQADKLIDRIDNDAIPESVPPDAGPTR